MSTILDALKGINAYPIPLRTLDDVAASRGLYLLEEATYDELSSRKFRLAKADLLLWLSYAPDISQGGQSYSFTDEQRADLRSRAKGIYEELKEDNYIPKSNYGYKGSRL